MRPRSSLVSFLQPYFLIGLLTFSLTAAWAAPTEKTLFTFTNDADGALPTPGVIAGPDGALYGATELSDNGFGFGTVFKLTPNSDGTWTMNVIHSFTGGVKDGANPSGGLTFDSHGNIYGTTTGHGAHGHGTVFKLSPNSDGSWTESLIYSFTNLADGGTPGTGVVMDTTGNLFGSTLFGGTGHNGVVYELSPNSDGTWTETTIYTGTRGGKFGGAPGPVILDSAGNVYGITNGGSFSAGSIFELSRNSSGTWTETILRSFTGKTDGANPASLVFDKSGNLYGTASTGGIANGCTGMVGCGTVFRLSPTVSGTWSFSRIYAFHGPDGFVPNALVLDRAGNLEGITLGGGANDQGVAYQLKPGSTGTPWTYRKLYDFSQNTTTSGFSPWSLTLASGHFYGTTLNTATCECGAVFEITP